MKKILLLMAVLSFISCSSNKENKDSFEEKAKKQMEQTMLEMSKNPETFKINNVKAVISNDSLCVLQFVTRGQNGFGGYSRSEMEYVLVKSKGKNGTLEYYESLKDLNEKGKEGEVNHPSIKDIYDDYINSTDERVLDDCKKRGLTLEEWTLDFAYGMSVINGQFFGRKVEDIINK